MVAIRLHRSCQHVHLGASEMAGAVENGNATENATAGERLKLHATEIGFVGNALHRETAGGDVAHPENAETMISISIVNVAAIWTMTETVSVESEKEIDPVRPRAMPCFHARNSITRDSRK